MSSAKDVDAITLKVATTTAAVNVTVAVDNTLVYGLCSTESWKLHREPGRLSIPKQRAMRM
jgi:hypothetical protein